jgi:glycerophosphoryl diester phosphodiesterase
LRPFWTERDRSAAACETGPVVLVIAHRGASAAAPENTLDAFLLARRLGADWVELDVRRTADGVVVVHHDAHLPDGRMLGDLGADDLPAALPSLAEALEACEGMGVNIEIKNLPDDPDFDADHMVSAAVAGLVAAYLGTERAVVSSFNVDAIDSLHRVDPSIPIGYITDLWDPTLAVDRAVAHDMQYLFPYDAMVDAALVRRAHGAGLKLHAWTVDDPRRMAELIDVGVDGIITNVPDVARRVIDGRS